MKIQTIDNNNYSINCFRAKNKAPKVKITNEAAKLYDEVGDELVSLFPLLKKLSDKDAKNEIKSLYQDIKNTLGLHSVGKSLNNDAIILKNPDSGDYLSVSQIEDSKNAIRSFNFIDLYYEKAAKGLLTHKVESYYCYDKKMVKNEEAKYTIPRVEDLEYYHEDDYHATKALEEFVARLGATRIFLFKLKEYIKKPEIKSVLEKHKLITEQQEPAQTPPKPTQLSYYQLMLKNRQRTKDEEAMLQGATHKADSMQHVTHPAEPTQEEGVIETQTDAQVVTVAKSPATQQEEVTTPGRKHRRRIPAGRVDVEHASGVNEKREGELHMNARGTVTRNGEVLSFSPIEFIKQQHEKGAPKNQNPYSRPHVTGQRTLFPDSQKGVVEGRTLQLFLDIKELFTNIYERLSKTKNSVMSNKIKYSYPTLKENNIAGTRILTFENIGKNGEDVSVNVVNYNDFSHVTLWVGKDGKGQYYALNRKKQLIKDPPLALKFGRQENNSENIVTYYTQEEIDSIDTSALSKLKVTLEDYYKHIDGTVSALETKRALHSNKDMGNMDDIADEIKDVFEQLENYKKCYKNFSHSKKRDEYLSRMDFQKTNNRNVIINNVGDDKKLIHLIPRQINDEKALVIQVLGPQKEVKQTFYLYQNKLVKNLIYEDTLSPVISHPDRGIYFHSQEYIEESGVKQIIDDIRTRLNKSQEIYEELNEGPIAKTESAKQTGKSEQLQERRTIKSQLPEEQPQSATVGTPALRAGNGFLLEDELKLFEDIKEQFEKAQENLKIFENKSTRSGIKNGFESIDGNHDKGSKVLKFKDEKGGFISVALRGYHEVNCPIILIENADGKKIYLGLNHKNRLLKIPPALLDFDWKSNGCSRKNVEFYTPEEIESLNLKEKLTPLKNLLEKYNNYILEKIENYNLRKTLHSKDDIGSLADKHDAIENVMKLIKAYREHYNSLPSAQKSKFIEQMNTQHTNHKITINDFGKDGISVIISPRKHDGKDGLLIQKGEDSYCILDDKLVKNTVKLEFKNSKTEIIHSGDVTMYYHSQKYIDDSGIKQIIDEIVTRLSKSQEIRDELKNEWIESSRTRKLEKGQEIKSPTDDLLKLLNDFAQNVTKMFSDFSKHINGSATNPDIMTLVQVTLTNISDNVQGGLNTLKTALDILMKKSQ